MDIAAVQSRFARTGRLTRIDLKLAPGVAPAAARTALQAILPAGVLIEAPEQQPARQPTCRAPTGSI
jgi:putative ABC transport system permease protein